MNTPDVLKPLLKHLEPWYADMAPGKCGVIASDIMNAIFRGERPPELESYGVVTVQVLFGHKSDVVLRGKDRPEDKFPRGPSLEFKQVARGMWVPARAEPRALTATLHVVVLCKMRDGTFAILDGNEGQFSHILGECTMHVQVQDFDMKRATKNPLPKANIEEEDAA